MKKFALLKLITQIKHLKDVLRSLYYLDEDFRSINHLDNISKAIEAYEEHINKQNNL